MRVKAHPNYYYEELRRPLTTWISVDDYALFRAVALSNKVAPAAYLRAVVMDVLAEERSKFIGPCEAKGVPLKRRRLPLPTE
jgi:hypothetical protein